MWALWATGLLCGMSVGLEVSAQTLEDWTLPGLAENSIGVHYGDGAGRTLAGDIDLTLPARLNLRASYQDSDFSAVGETDRYAKYGLNLTTDPFAPWSAGIAYEYSGNSDSLQTEDVGVGVQYYSGTWLVSVRYLVGEVELAGRSVSQPTLEREFEQDRQVAELTLQYFNQAWQYALSAQHYSYERDIDLSADSLRVRRALGASSFSQLFGLLRYYLAADVGYQQGKHSWQAGLTSYRLETSDEQGGGPNLGWKYQLTDAISVGALFALGIDEAENYGEAELRFHF